MTNAEKFREVFGIEIDEIPIDPCDMFHNSICMNHECDDCPAWHFWEKEYNKVKNETS